MKIIQNLLKKPFMTIILSICIGLLVGAVILSLAGFNPFEAYLALIKGIFSKPKYLSNVIIKSSPIILTGLSIAFAFRTGLFNIGAEGQYIIGTIVAVLLGYGLKLPPGIHFFVVVIGAMIISGLWGGFVGLLKAKFGINEVITSIMLNWIALYLNNYFVSLPWLRAPGTDSSYSIHKSAWSMVLSNFKSSPEARSRLINHPIISETLLKTDMNYGILIAILTSVIIWIMLKYTSKGFEFRAVGLNKNASEFAGINSKNNIIWAMFISGAIAGLAGALQITGITPHRIGQLSVHEGYGFDGISVALVAGSSPIACIFSGLLFGALKYGAISMQTTVGASTEIINIVIGTIIFVIAMSSVFKILAVKIGASKRLRKMINFNRSGGSDSC